MRSKSGRFMEGLHVVGGVTLVSKISIIMCLISIKMHVCDACIFSCIPLHVRIVVNYI
jgi:hypothetical protein